jgi:hypothetical protein
MVVSTVYALYDEPLTLSPEYEKAHANLGDYNDEAPYRSYGRRPSPTFDMFTKLLNDLPMVKS